MLLWEKLRPCFSRFHRILNFVRISLFDSAAAFLVGFLSFNLLKIIFSQNQSFDQVDKEGPFFAQKVLEVILMHIKSSYTIIKIEMSNSKFVKSKFV